MISFAKTATLAIALSGLASLSPAAIYQGGPGDGFGERLVPRITLNGTSAGVRYCGGHGDGYAAIALTHQGTSSVSQWQTYEVAPQLRRRPE